MFLPFGSSVDSNQGMSVCPLRTCQRLGRQTRGLERGIGLFSIAMAMEITAWVATAPKRYLSLTWFPSYYEEFRETPALVSYGLLLVGGCLLFIGRRGGAAFHLAFAITQCMALAGGVGYNALKMVESTQPTDYAVGVAVANADGFSYVVYGLVLVMWLARSRQSRRRLDGAATAQAQVAGGRWQGWHVTLGVLSILAGGKLIVDVVSRWVLYALNASYLPDFAFAHPLWAVLLGMSSHGFYRDVFPVALAPVLLLAGVALLRCWRLGCVLQLATIAALLVWFGYVLLAFPAASDGNDDRGYNEWGLLMHPHYTMPLYFRYCSFAHPLLLACCLCIAGIREDVRSAARGHADRRRRIRGPAGGVAVCLAFALPAGCLLWEVRCRRVPEYRFVDAEVRLPRCAEARRVPLVSNDAVLSILDEESCSFSDRCPIGAPYSVLGEPDMHPVRYSTGAFEEWRRGPDSPLFVHRGRPWQLLLACERRAPFEVTARWLESAAFSGARRIVLLAAGTRLRKADVDVLVGSAIGCSFDVPHPGEVIEAIRGEKLMRIEVPSYGEPRVLPPAHRSPESSDGKLVIASVAAEPNAAYEQVIRGVETALVQGFHQLIFLPSSRNKGEDQGEMVACRRFTGSWPRDSVVFPGAWEILGPLALRMEGSVREAFELEPSPSDRELDEANFRVPPGKEVRWKPVLLRVPAINTDGGPPRTFDLIRTRLFSDTEREVFALFEASGLAVVRVNEEQVWTESGLRTSEPSRNRVMLRLRPGTNEVLVKLLRRPVPSVFSMKCLVNWQVPVPGMPSGLGVTRQARPHKVR